MRLLIITALAALTLSCSSSAPIAVQQNSNAGPMTGNAERPQTAIAHGPKEQAPQTSNGTKSKWSQGGDPVDTKEFDTAIASAEKALSSKPDDAAAKKALGTAYFNRAEALTEARQYASALGDYRRTLKYDPANSGAKEWIERIVSIYDSINRDSPKEGEEPPPLPFGK